MHLASGWWVEIYLGELPLPDRQKKGILSEWREWLVPYRAPKWAIKGATAKQALAKAASQFAKAGIPLRDATQALAKFRSAQH